MALPARYYLSYRVLGLVIACALLSLILFNAGTAKHLRDTYNSLSTQAKQSAAASALAGDEQSHDVKAPPTSIFEEPPDVDAQPQHVKSPSTSNSNEQLEVDAQLHNATIPSTTIPDPKPDIDAQPHNVTTPSTSISSPFPPLPPPDDEEYMSICMAGEHS